MSTRGCQAMRRFVESSRACLFSPVYYTTTPHNHPPTFTSPMTASVMSFRLSLHFAPPFAKVGDMHAAVLSAVLQRPFGIKVWLNSWAAIRGCGVFTEGLGEGESSELRIGVRQVKHSLASSRQPRKGPPWPSHADTKIDRERARLCVGEGTCGDDSWPCRRIGFTVGGRPDRIREEKNT